MEYPNNGEKIENIIIIDKRKPGRPKKYQNETRNDQVRRAVAKHYENNKDKVKANSRKNYFAKQGIDSNQKVKTQCIYVHDEIQCVNMTYRTWCHRHINKMNDN